MKQLILLLMIACAAITCQAQPDSPEAYKKGKVFFGSGGGFTGAVTTWCLLKNGHLYEQKWKDTTYTYLLRAPRKEARAIFKQISELDAKALSINMPGNMYSFVDIPGESENTRVVWGAPGVEVPANLLGLYDSLVRLTRPEK